MENKTEVDYFSKMYPLNSIKIDNRFIERHKKEFRFLKDIELSENNVAYAFSHKSMKTMKTLFIGFVYMEKKNDYTWLEGLEIKDPAAYLLAPQLIDFAIKNGANIASINKNNSKAIKMLEDAGFKISSEENRAYIMKL